MMSFTNFQRHANPNYKNLSAHRQTGRQTDRQTGTGRQTDRQTGRHRQTGRQTDRQTVVPYNTA